MGGGARDGLIGKATLEPRPGGALENLGQTGQAAANMAMYPMPVYPASLGGSKDRYSERKPGLFRELSLQGLGLDWMGHMTSRFGTRILIRTIQCPRHSGSAHKCNMTLAKGLGGQSPKQM